WRRRSPYCRCASGGGGNVSVKSIAWPRLVEMASPKVQTEIVRRGGGTTPTEVGVDVLRALLPGLDPAGQDTAFVTRLMRRLEPSSAASEGSIEGGARLTGALQEINALIHGVKAGAAESPRRINYARCVSTGSFVPTSARLIRFIKDGSEV